MDIVTKKWKAWNKKGNHEYCGFIYFPWTMLLLWEKMWEICLLYIRFGWNFLACVTKATSVHTLEGCSVLWITGLSFEEPSLPCTGTLGALACEKGGNKVVKFAQSTPPPLPYPFIPALFSLLNMKSRTGGMPNTSHTSDDSWACTGHKQHIYKHKSIQASNCHWPPNMWPVSRHLFF